MKKLMLVIATVLVMSLLVPIACAKAPEPRPAPAPAPAPSPQSTLFGGIRETPAPVINIPPPASSGREATSSGEAVLYEGEERMIIRNGDMSLVVKDVVQARDEIAQMAVRLAGYVVSSGISGEEEGMRGNIAIRVPDDKFGAAISELRSLAIRVRSENTNSQDVTEQYVDLKSRLKNAEATENQYLTILAKATDVEDILSVYERLSQVRREIEQLKGQMQYLERTSSMSLISVSLRPEASAKPLASAGWSAMEILKSAVRGIVTFGQWLVALTIWLIIFSPVWGAILGIIYWRRRKRKKVAA
ncbi:DUF4349 domain-containing protein [Chloroflexota bacterium]